MFRLNSVDDAVELANPTPYGLGAVVFGADHVLLESVATPLEEDMASNNAPSMTQPELPFGGVKASGTGRELGEYGLGELANHKLYRWP